MFASVGVGIVVGSFVHTVVNIDGEGVGTIVGTSVLVAPVGKGVLTPVGMGVGTSVGKAVLTGVGRPVGKSDNTRVGMGVGTPVEKLSL